ncbi:MAG: mandelate racemase/muconate lactonizing enzyme family protein [Caldilineaceae bacterium]
MYASLEWRGSGDGSALYRAFFSPLLVGQDPTQINALLPQINKCVAANPFTKSALEMALWDILGKAAGLPVYQLLGGAVRDFVTTKFSVSGVEPPQAAAIATWAVEQGFRTMKVKVGIEPDSDVARVRAVREAVGPDIRLGVDANGGWTRRLPFRQSIGCSTMISTLPSNQSPRWTLTGWPMCGARCRFRSWPMKAFIRCKMPLPLRAPTPPMCSLFMWAKGALRRRAIAAVAEAAGLVCTVGSNLELGIGNAAMIHLALATAAIAAERFPCDILSPFYYESDLLTEPLPIEAGRATAPDGPGLGVTLDDKLVERYRNDK